MLYSDLATCVKIMLSMEQKKEKAESVELRQRLEKVTSSDS